MRILTKLLLVCAMAAIISPFSGRAADTDAQIKAREALRQKMSELQVQPMETNAAPPVAAPRKAPKTKSAPAPVVTQPTPAPAPAQTMKTVPPPVQTPAPVVETTTSTPAPAPAPTVKTTPPPKVKPVAKSTTSSGQMTASRPDSERIAKARAALQDKMRELQQQPEQGGSVASTRAPAPSTPPPVASSSTPSSQLTANAEPNVSNEPLPTPPPVKKSAQADKKSKEPKTPSPMPESRPRYALPTGPPAPVSAEKLQKLDVLLQQYKADQITPEQYHEERAKILAGP